MRSFIISVSFILCLFVLNKVDAQTLDIFNVSLNKGMLAVKEGKDEEAINWFDKALRMDSTNSALWYEKAKAHNRLNQVEKFVDALNHCLELEPGIAELYLVRGEAYEKLGDEERAYEDYSRIIGDIHSGEGDSVYYVTCMKRGRLNYLKENYAECIRDLDHYLIFNPDSWEALQNRGQAKFLMKEYKESLVDFSSSISIDLYQPELYYGRSLTYFELEDYRKALVDLNRAIALKPDYKEAFIERALVKDALEDEEGAISDLEKAYQLDKTDPQIHFLRGNAWFKYDEVKKACSAWKEADNLGWKGAEEKLKENCK